MWLIGRDVLGEAVIGMLYLAPIAWCANKWGQAAGMSAALSAALCLISCSFRLSIPLPLAVWKAGWYWLFSLR